MCEKVSCATQSQFWPLLQQCESLGKEVYILLTGEKNPAGVSWCPDCVRAEPIIDEVFETHSNAVMLVCAINRVEFRNRDDQSYVYRDPRINIKCVPTLLRWHHGKAIASLDDSQCQVKELVSELIC